MAGALRYTVVVRHPDSGIATPLLAGEEVPDWATDLVHGDDLEGDTKTPAKRSASSKTEK